MHNTHTSIFSRWRVKKLIYALCKKIANFNFCYIVRKKSLKIEFREKPSILCVCINSLYTRVSTDREIIDPSISVKSWDSGEKTAHEKKRNMKEEARRANEMKCRKNEIIIMFMPCMRRLCTLFLLLLVVSQKNREKRREKKKNAFMLLCGAVISQMKDFFVWCCFTQRRWMTAEDCLWKKIQQFRDALIEKQFEKWMKEWVIISLRKWKIALNYKLSMFVRPMRKKWKKDSRKHFETSHWVLRTFQLSLKTQSWLQSKLHFHFCENLDIISFFIQPDRIARKHFDFCRS